jgi:hypothetical protein
LCLTATIDGIIASCLDPDGKLVMFLPALVAVNGSGAKWISGG